MIKLPQITKNNISTVDPKVFLTDYLQSFFYVIKFNTRLKKKLNEFPYYECFETMQLKNTVTGN